MRNTDWSCLDFFKPARKTKKNMIKRMKLFLVGDVTINLVKSFSCINMHILLTVLHIFF